MLLSPALTDERPVRATTHLRNFAKQVRTFRQCSAPGVALTHRPSSRARIATPTPVPASRSDPAMRTGHRPGGIRAPGRSPRPLLTRDQRNHRDHQHPLAVPKRIGVRHARVHRLVSTRIMSFPPDQSTVSIDQPASPGASSFVAGDQVTPPSTEVQTASYETVFPDPRPGDPLSRLSRFRFVLTGSGARVEAPDGHARSTKGTRAKFWPVSCGAGRSHLRARPRRSTHSYLLCDRCANATTTPQPGEIVESSTLEPESRIELLTYSLRVIWHSTLC